VGGYHGGSYDGYRKKIEIGVFPDGKIRIASHDRSDGYYGALKIFKTSVSNLHSNPKEAERQLEFCYKNAHHTSPTIVPLVLVLYINISMS